jgi:hypothetical protein
MRQLTARLGEILAGPFFCLKKERGMAGESVDVGVWSFAWSMLVSIGVALLAIGSFREKVAIKKEVEAALEEMKTDIQNRLYQKDGTTIFTPRAECEKSQTSCSNRVCAKLDEMRADTQRRHEEGLETQREHLRLHGDIAEFVGAMKQFVKQHDKGE